MPPKKAANAAAIAKKPAAKRGPKPASVAGHIAPDVAAAPDASFADDPYASDDSARAEQDAQAEQGDVAPWDAESVVYENDAPVEGWPLAVDADETLAEGDVVTIGDTEFVEEFVLLGSAGVELGSVMMGTTTPDGELPLDDARPVDQPALTFTSGDERRMTSLALQSYAADLKALAKKATDMGRHLDARGMLRDATLVQEQLLAQLNVQVGLPLNEEGTLRDALINTVGAAVRSKVGRALSETETATFEKVFGKIATLTTEALLPILHDLAERAFDAGRRARDLTPEHIAREAVYKASAQAPLP